MNVKRTVEIVPSQPRRSATPTAGATTGGGATSSPVRDSREATPATSGSTLNSAAMALLQLQAEMRKARTKAELAYFLANEPRRLLRAQQIAVLETRDVAKPVVQAVSSLTTVDRSSPLILWFESVVAALGRQFGLAEVREFDAAAFSGDYDDIQSSYPLRNLLWLPWVDLDGRTVGGSLVARSTPWTETEIRIAKHLASAFAHAWKAFERVSVLSSIAPYMTRRALFVAGIASAALLLFPVSMSALAPTEVVPREPFVVTSGVEGVIKNVLVSPNDRVEPGQTLITLADTVLRNRYELAEREVTIAETRYKKAAQLAFVDARGRHDLATAISELELKRSERTFARELLERTEIKAEKAGIAFYADKTDLIGRPVVVGEKLMEIARPTHAEFQIDLPVSDAIVLRPGARVKVFLDSDPLHPIEAKLVRAAYKATLRENQTLAFRLVAETDTANPTSMRLGARGTAQVYSDRVPLGFYLFRRPIAAARQWLGV